MVNGSRRISRRGYQSVALVMFLALAPPATVAELHESGGEGWLVRALRELDDALCHLRFDQLA